MTRQPVRRRPGVRGCRTDDGSATILVVAALGVLTMLLLAGLVMTAAVTASHRARSAADLGALAGALAVQGGLAPGDACARAAVVAARNDGRLLSCEVQDGGVVIVAAVVPVTGPLRLRTSVGWPGTVPLMARAWSKAGPSP